MKKITLLLAAVSILFTNCMGEYKLFHNLDSWNKKVTKSKFANNIIFWVLNIIPVYSVAFVVDVLILNLIEFWTGSNPVSMKPGETKEKALTIEGISYKFTAKKDAMKVNILSGENIGKSLDLTFNKELNNWYMTNEAGKTIKLASIKEGLLHVYLPKKQVTLPLNTNATEGLSIINNRLATVAAN